MGEPFWKTLQRSTIAAAIIGVVLLLALPRHGSLASDFVDVFTLAFCFTFLAPYVDRLLLALPDVRTDFGPLVRVAGWFAGGLWCYVIARWNQLKPSAARPRRSGCPLGCCGGGVRLTAQGFTHTLLSRRTSGKFCSGSISTFTTAARTFRTQV
jgi:hypothetical protein